MLSHNMQSQKKPPNEGEVTGSTIKTHSYDLPFFSDKKCTIASEERCEIIVSRRGNRGSQ